MKKTFLFRIFSLFLAATLFSGVRPEAPVVRSSCLAPICRSISDSITVPERVGEAFESVFVSALRHWEELKGWTIQHTVELEDGSHTRPDLCYGVTPAQMLADGRIIVADVKLTRVADARYPDAFAKNNKYVKYRYHYAAVAIEKQNRERILQSLRDFLNWASHDSTGIAYNASELKDWGRIWSVIASRVQRAGKDGSADDRLFASCFKDFYDRMQDIIETGKLIDLRDDDAISPDGLVTLLKTAIYKYNVRKEVRILHPSILTLAKPFEKMLPDLDEKDKRDFVGIRLTYSNIFQEWKHFFRRETSDPIDETLQFFIGMYLGLWDFDGKQGLERDVRRIRWTDNKNEILNFPLFRFGIEKKLANISEHFISPNGKPLYISTIKRGMGVGPRSMKPQADTIVELASKKNMDYFHSFNVGNVSREMVKMFIAERRRLTDEKIRLGEFDQRDIMASVIRRYSVQNLPDKYFGTMIAAMLDAWPKEEPCPYLKTLLSEALSEVQKQMHGESAYVGHQIIRNESLNKSEALMHAVGFEILKTELAGSGKIDLNKVNLEGMGTGRNLITEFCNVFESEFKEEFGVAWPLDVLADFRSKYLKTADGLVFESVAHARMFLFYVGYLRDIWLEAEVEASKNARLGRRAPTSTAKKRSLTVAGFKILDAAGRVEGPAISKGVNVTKTFDNLGTCIRSYAHAIEDMETERNKILAVIEFYEKEKTAHKDRILGFMNEFVSRVIGLKEREPVNSDNIIIRDMALLLSAECHKEQVDYKRVSLISDALINSLVSRQKVINGMGYTFKERSSMLFQAASGRLDRIMEIVADCLYKKDDPLAEVAGLLEKYEKSPKLTRNLRACFNAIYDKLEAGADIGEAFILLDDYITSNELDTIEEYMYSYKVRYKKLVTYIHEQAADARNFSQLRAAA